VKTLVLFGVSKVMKQCSGFGIRLGLTLSQGSEFSFVLFTLAAAQHIIPRESADFLMAMVGITLTVTPFLVKLGNRLAYAWERESSRNNLNEAGLKKLVYIKGFDATGQEIARILTSAGVDYLGYDDDKERIAMNRSLGFQVDVSDIHRPRLLSALTTAQAQAVILLIDDADAAVTILTAIQELKLSIPVYAATNDVSLYDAMQGFDLNAILVKDNETAYTIAQRLLQNLSYPDDEIETHIETIRQRKLAIR
jgi:hypothetical protein